MNLTHEETKTVIVALRKHRAEFKYDARDTMNTHEYLQTEELLKKFMDVYEEQMENIVHLSHEMLEEAHEEAEAVG